MKKFRLLKDLPYTKAWIIYTKSDDNYSWIYNYVSEKINNWRIDYLNKEDVEDNPEWFEEVKEELKPKFKIWDYVVCESTSPRWSKIKKYIKIIDIRIKSDNYIEYNRDSALWYYSEHELRLPTEEELEKYFR